MNRQTFHKYLEEPSKLYQLSLTELQGLVMDYPYSSNLRLLLLLKARLEGHPKADLITSQVAARTFDRAHLYRLLNELEIEAEAAGDTLELKGLEELDIELLNAEPLIREEATAKEEELAVPNTTAPVTSGIEQEEEDYDQGMSPEISEVADVEPEATPTIKDDVAEAATSAAAPPLQTPVSTPLKSRLERLKRRQLARLEKPELTGPETSLKQIARRSVSRHRGVASETLAKLLVGQGQYLRAIKMYEELSLAHPEKKSIFAGLIKELKEKL